LKDCALLQAPVHEHLGPIAEEEMLEYLLAYGPFVHPFKTSEHDKPFEYRLFKYYTHVPTDNKLRIAYGNLPFYPVRLLRLDDEISEEYIASLPHEFTRLIIKAVELLRTGYAHPTDVIPVEHGSVFDFAYPPSDTACNIHRYPAIEVILGLATLFVHYPHGEHARYFRRWQPTAARSLFESPTPPLFYKGSNSSLELPEYLSPSSCEWEEVSSASFSPPTLISDTKSLSDDIPYLEEGGFTSSVTTSSVSNPSPPYFMNVDYEDHLDIYASDDENEPEIPAAPRPTTMELPLSQSSFPLSDVRETWTANDAQDKNLPPSSISVIAEIDESYTNTEHVKTEVSDELPTHSSVSPSRPSFPDLPSAEFDGWDNHLYWNLQGPQCFSDDLPELYNGPISNEPGIFAYGPTSENNGTFDYHIYVHSTYERDVLEYCGYGGPKFLNGEHVHLLQLQISPYTLDSSLDFVQEFGHIIPQVEAYLRKDPRFPNGVLIPQELQKNPIQITVPSDKVYYRFPLVEKLFGTIAARFSFPQLAHPFGQLTTHDIRRFVSPVFPVLQNPQLLVKDLFPPHLPYVPAHFFPFERRYLDDINPELPFPYFGCLPRYEAFLFQKNLPIFGPQLFHEALATLQLIALHADPRSRPPPTQDGRIDWDGILEPYGFADYFPTDTPTRILSRACTRPIKTNYWFPRAHYILHCARHINQLIRAFETFFHTLEYDDGLSNIVKDAKLNMEIDYLYSPILSIDQAVYFTALYDFLLREHALFLARPILQLLHISFPEPTQLNLVFKHIIDTVERPLYSYLLDDEEETNSSSSRW
jgi:hypothetical protein